MEVWNACGLKDYKVFIEPDGIALHKVDAHGVDQEMYFLIKKECDEWNSYLVQRGKPFKRYSTPSFEMAQVSVSLLYIKYFMFHLKAFRWTDTEELVRVGDLSGAINRLNQKMGLAENHGVFLREEASQYRIVMQNKSRAEELFSSPKVQEALRVYRYYSLLRKCLNAALDKLMPEFPQLTNERERLCTMVMK